MRLISVLVCMVFCVVSTAQNFPIKHLLEDSVPVAFITPAKNFYFNLGDSTHNKYKPQQFIKNGKVLYLFLNGTGRLYETSVDNSNSCVFDRIDITDHFGYNISSFGFSYNNCIYNLGGGGIWHINGQLRVYNTKAKEWDIVKLNKEIPVLYEENLLWYDIKAHKIYIGLYSSTNDAVKTNTTDSKLVYDVMVLDLAATDWTKIGDLSSYLKLNNAQMKPIAMSPWGLLININSKFFLINYSSNQILSLEASKENDYQSLQRTFSSNNCYFKDSTLYYGDNIAQTLDSIPLHYADFKPTGEIVYTIAAITVASSSLPWLIGGLLVLVSAAIFYLLKYKVSIQILKKPVINEVKHTTLPREESSINELNTNTTTSYFDEKELQVLQLLFDNSTKQLTTSIEALNNVLGVTKKANDVQKKQRSDVMGSINKKFGFISQNKQAIIEKTRADVDKRSFEYFIANERLEEVKAVITTI